MSKPTLEKLNSLRDVQFEDWLSNGVSLRAVSADASGQVNSGILRDGRYFYRVWSKDLRGSTFVWGDK